MLPLVVLSESYASYRLLYPLSASIWITWIASYETLIKFRLVATAVACASLAALSLSAYRHARALVSIPYAEEWSESKRALASINATLENSRTETWSVAIILAELWQTRAPKLSTNEFGFPHTHLDYSSSGMLFIVESQLTGLDRSRQEVFFLTRKEFNESNKQFDQVIELGALDRQPPNWMQP